MKSVIIFILICGIFGFAVHFFSADGSGDQSHNSVTAISVEEWESLSSRFEDFSDTRQLLGGPVKSQQILDVLHEHNIATEAFRKAGAQALKDALKDVTPERDPAGTLVSRPDGEDFHVSLDDDHDAHASGTDSLALRLLYGLSRSSKGP